ncbi:hypothetical protein STXM2123_319 [Streptomyces sp. F-3]|uniref:Integral membrane protein n=2 Tax=Streptomyces TaxID=1883 RepID=A0ABP4DCN9_9ACTN|nr:MULTISPECIES: hypothetical protein [unclassified Streptomyces]MDN5383852.1 hypothetical protein [Streptomyces sp. LB8]GAT79618.1 hypothetical protein STXM2123_319 [Streptomyces sp. F-3]
MRVIRVVLAALLGLGALTFSAPAAVAYGGDDHSYGSDGRSHGGGGGHGGGGHGRHGGEDENRFGGHGGHRPEHFRHGIRAGEGGSGSGFDLQKIGTGAALVAGSVGAAYYLSRRRGDEGGSTA